MQKYLNIMYTRCNICTICTYIIYADTDMYQIYAGLL